MNCRYCKKNLNDCFLDLGTAPPSNSYLIKNQLNMAESYYPLKVYVCKNCWLVQVIDYARRDISPSRTLFNPSASSDLIVRPVFVDCPKLPPAILNKAPL